MKQTALAKEIEKSFDKLWPILRSITGQGARQTHNILSNVYPLNTFEVPTGKKILDWEVPKEWVVKEAYLLDPDGEKIIDVKDNNLHLLGYCAPFDGEVSLEELQKHLYSIEDMPCAIPYVTSYYKKRWGFCIEDGKRQNLREGLYRVKIDTEFIDGSMTISDCVLPGTSDKEVLISTYTCHPSMANNELSGPLVSIYLLRELSRLKKRRLTYRFVFLPETVGAIGYLAKHGEWLKQKCVAGFVLTCIGDPAPFTYKKSRDGNSLADRAAIHCLSGFQHEPERILDFFPSGSDERQYCSPGFNLPVGVMARSIYQRYDQYHTSLDNRGFISFDTMAESVNVLLDILSIIDRNVIYKNLFPYGEPRFDKRNLQTTIGAKRDVDNRLRAIKWLLNLSDMKHDTLSIAERSGIDFGLLSEVADECVSAGLLCVENGDSGNE